VNHNADPSLDGNSTVRQAGKDAGDYLRPLGGGSIQAPPSHDVNPRYLTYSLQAAGGLFSHLRLLDTMIAPLRGNTVTATVRLNRTGQR